MGGGSRKFSATQKACTGGQNELEEQTLLEPSVQKCKVLCEWISDCRAVSFLKRDGPDGIKYECHMYKACDVTDDWSAIPGDNRVGDTYLLNNIAPTDVERAGQDVLQRTGRGLLQVLSHNAYPNTHLAIKKRRPSHAFATTALSVGADGEIHMEQPPDETAFSRCVGVHCQAASFSQHREQSGEAIRQFSGDPHVAFVLDAGKPVRALAVTSGLLYAASDGGAVTSWDIQRGSTPAKNVWRVNMSTAPGLENIAVGPNGLLAVHRGGAELYKGGLKYGLPAASSVTSAKTISSSTLGADGRSFYLASQSDVWHIDLTSMREISRWSIGSLPKIAGRRRRDRSWMVRPLRNPQVAAAGATGVWTPSPHVEPDLRREAAPGHLAEQ
jgi:hypothetical protein